MIRRMLEAVGYPVLSLRRTRVGPLTLRGLAVGEWRHLAAEEIAQLQAAVAGTEVTGSS